MKLDPSMLTGGLIGVTISAIGAAWGVYAKRNTDLKIHTDDHEDKSADRTDRQLNASLKRLEDCEKRERENATDKSVSERLISTIEGEVTVISGTLENLITVQDPLCPGAPLALRYIAVIQAGCARIRGRLDEQRGALIKEAKPSEGEHK